MTISSAAGMVSQSGNAKNDRLNTEEKRGFCLGVLTQGAVPQGYEEVLSDRHDAADPVVRRVFDNYAEKLLIQNAEYPPGRIPHYAPENHNGHPRGVYYNAEADMNNPRGAGATYYHELGHMIDHAATGFQSRLSETEEFKEALISDGYEVLEIYRGMSDAEKNGFINVIRQDAAHSFSDLIDAITNGQLHGSYGHTGDYWKNEGMLQAEAFAHFFEASMGGGDKREFLSNMFPTAYAMFMEMMENLQPVFKERVLR